MENAVFLELKRSNRELFYFRDQANECDFLCADRGHVFEAVQVCHDVSSQDTKRREVKGLAAACRQFNLEKGTFVVSDGPDTWEVDGLRIDVVPFYRFALSGA